jgi:mono/diheme cytochrome c family protein
MTCHSGRASKIDVDNAEPQADGTYRFVNIHYRAAGASLFGNMAKGGYEYDGNVYASKFEHVVSNDLCIECHNAHSGELFFQDPGFGPTGCVNCHAEAVDVAGVRDIRMIASVADYDGDGDAAEGIYYEVDTLKIELEAVLVASGVTVLPGYPYFGNITTEEQLRAAYNLQVASKDPGSWAHNPSYTKQLLIDSLADMGQTTNSVTGFAYVRDDSGHFASQDEPFRHWDLTFDPATGEYDDGSISSSCNKCHSSEGGAYFLDNGVAKTTYDNLYTMGISSGLACETCHTAPFTGDVRFVESVEFPSGITITEPAFSGNDSTVCMTCHQGRAWKGTVDNEISNWDGVSEFRFTNIHYFAAAASLFGHDVLGGYEYDANSNIGAQSYLGQNVFPAHPDALKTCTGCHLQEGGNDHSFIPNIARCNNCHPGATFEELLNTPNANYIAINTLKNELQVVLEASGVIFLDHYPYFDNLLTPAELKAAYNWQTADKEPAGFVHNGGYIQQLLYDSILDMGGTPSITAPGRSLPGVPLDGQALFVSNCGACHTGNGAGTGTVADLTGMGAEAIDKINGGHQGIVLPADELQAIADFLDAP